MAGLVEGQQYGLSAQDKINCSKSLVFVKLTDSAIRSIEEYVKNKGQHGPTIQFQNSTGVISLPQNGSNQTYGFTLSNVEADGPHGSFECLRQTGQGHKSLESLGCMQLKMHIHATEDSYENTRVKMAAVEKEQKKSCTKVIKPAGAHLGRKVKVKRPVQMVSPLKSSPPAAAMLSKPAPKPPVMPTLPPKKPEPPHRPKPPPPKNPELVRQPIRDRIIHLLAVRPYKRPELLVRLANDGLREKDKNTLSSILPQLSVLKGNIYYLNKGCWKEVQENWKFCTQEELEIIRKRKQQNEGTPDKVEHDPPAPSPQNNVSPPQKRVLGEVETNGNPRNKKQRISHYKGDQQQPQPPPPPQRNGVHPPPSDISSSTQQHPSSKRPRHSPAHEELLHRSPAYPSPTEKPPPKPRPPARPPNSRLMPPEKTCRPPPPAAFNGSARPSKVSSTTNGSCSASPHSSSDSRDSMEYNDGLQVPPPTESPTQCDSPEYEKEYCRIESDEQRARYKANFNAEYQEYLYLHEKIISISKKFASLEKHLHTCDEGSEDFVKIKGKIIKEYRAYQQDPGYLGALKKFNYLHTKLAYIKRLVTEYDMAQCTKS